MSSKNEWTFVAQAGSSPVRCPQRPAQQGLSCWGSVLSFNLELLRAEYSGVFRNHLKMSPRNAGFRKTQAENGTTSKESVTNHVVCKMPENKSLLGHNNKA